MNIIKMSQPSLPSLGMRLGSWLCYLNVQHVASTVVRSILIILVGYSFQLR